MRKKKQLISAVCLYFFMIKKTRATSLGNRVNDSHHYSFVVQIIIILKVHTSYRFRGNLNFPAFFSYLPTCRIPSEVCKSGGEPVVNLVQSQLTLRGFDHCLHGVNNKKMV